jgi:hypothetical protein
VHGFNDQELCDDDFLSSGWIPKELEDAQDLLDRSNEQNQQAKERSTVSEEPSHVSEHPAQQSLPSPPSPSQPYLRSTPPITSFISETVYNEIGRPNEDSTERGAVIGCEEVAGVTASS